MAFVMISKLRKIKIIFFFRISCYHPGKFEQESVKYKHKMECSITNKNSKKIGY